MATVSPLIGKISDITSAFTAVGTPANAFVGLNHTTQQFSISANPTDFHANALTLSELGSGSAPLNTGSSSSTPNGTLGLTSAGAFTSLFLGITSTYSWIQSQNRNDMSLLLPLYIQPLGGNVAIGGVAQIWKLTVDGTLSAFYSDATALRTDSNNLVDSDVNADKIVATHLRNNSDGASRTTINIRTRTTSASAWEISNEHQSNFNGDLTFRGRYASSNSREVMRLKSTGEVSIPNGNLIIEGDGPTFGRVSATTGAAGNRPFFDVVNAQDDTIVMRIDDISSGSGGVFSLSRSRLAELVSNTTTNMAIGTLNAASLYLGTNNTAAMIIDTNQNVLIPDGKVGIGVPTPIYDIHVNKDNGASCRCLSTMTADAQSTEWVAEGTANSLTRQGSIGVTYNTATPVNAPVAYMLLQENDGGPMYYWTDNNGIFYSSSVSNNIGTSSGTIVGTQTSDERGKSNISSLSYGLSTVMSLIPVSFDMNGEPDIGFTAQQVLPLIPEAVYDSNEDRYDDPENTHLNMHYAKIIAVNTKAIQELKNEKDAEIAALQAENASLTTRIEALES